VWLIHDPENDSGLTGVFFRELGPEIRKLSISRSALSYDAAVPSRI